MCALSGATGPQAPHNRPSPRGEEQMSTRDLHVETITDDLHTVYSSLHRLSLPTLLKLDLTMAQFKALVVVEGSSGISVCEVGRELGIGESAASLLVDQLVRHGYVGRTTDQADRRRVLLAATAPGKKLLRELRHGRRQSLEGWLADLGDDDLDVLASGLHALTALVSAGTSPAARVAPTEKTRI
jgi:DNA-binding MarR family transcriptional regulator